MSNMTVNQRNQYDRATYSAPTGVGVRSKRRLIILNVVLVLIAAVLVAGCGSDDNNGSAKAPTSAKVAASSSGSGQAAAVSATAAPKIPVLCAAEGRKAVKGKVPFGQCVAALTKLKKGKAKNPRAACKGLTTKKSKGTFGKSPYVVCLRAAGKLMVVKAGKKVSFSNIRSHYLAEDAADAVRWALENVHEAEDGGLYIKGTIWP